MTTEVQGKFGSQGTEPAGPAQIDPMRLEAFNRKLREDQSMPLGFLGGAFAALGAALLWAVITVVTDYQIGWMAVGVGFLVGYAIRSFGQGVDKVFGFMGAGLSLLGCLAGNFLTIVIVIAQEEAAPFLDVLAFFALTPAAVVEAIALTFSPIDLLFYAIAVYEGYRFAFRRITKEELQSLTL